MTGFDPDTILRTLDAHGVRFVVMGGLAGNFRGTADVTNDLDVCYARDAENLERLAAALEELDARSRGLACPTMSPFAVDALALRHGDTFTFVTSAGRSTSSLRRAARRDSKISTRAPRRSISATGSSSGWLRSTT